MTIIHSFTPAALGFIERRVSALGISDFKKNYFPAVMWSLGGSIHRKNEPTPIPPHYALAYIKRSDLSKLIAVAHPAFEYIALRLSPEDALEDKAIMDHDETAFFMR